jgi:hypothetical protein
MTVAIVLHNRSGGSWVMGENEKDTEHEADLDVESKVIPVTGRGGL